MKKLRNLIALMAVASMAAVFTGCGDEGGDDNGGGNQNPQNFAPGTQADLTAQNKVYTINVPGEDPITLTFPSAGRYQIVQGNRTEIGSISAVSKSGESWQLSATPDGGQTGAQEGVLLLNWTGANAGSWTFTPTGGTAESGTFSVTETPPGGTTGTQTNTNTNTNVTGNLTGKTLQISYAGGGGDRFDFTSDTAVSWENGTSTGTYTYDQTANNVDVALADGQIFDIQLSGSSPGNATVNYRQGGGETQVFTGTYTLTP